MASKISAFRIERRRISVAVFVDTRLDYTDSRQLPSLYPKALDSACRFVDWIRRSFWIDAVALEKSQPDSETWKGRFTIEIIKQLRADGIPIFEVETQVLLDSFAHPPLRYRTQLRRVVSAIWPILASKYKPTACLDAAALGLQVQVENMFADQ